MAGEGFRPDLYHRLATISLWLPPRRERGGDGLQLAGEFLARACGDYGWPQADAGGAGRDAGTPGPATSGSWPTRWSAWRC
jgi:DNA-binding NtrC family response regulator